MGFFSFSSFFSRSAADHWLFVAVFSLALCESLFCRFWAMGKSHHSASTSPGFYDKGNPIWIKKGFVLDGIDAKQNKTKQNINTHR